MNEGGSNLSKGEVSRVVEPAGPVLDIVQGLLERLHDADLRYCHWKSNEHLEAAVCGHTDLDVLVETGRTDDLNRILAESGFRRFQSTAFTAYPGVEDYLACDDGTGQLVHLHLHHRLTLGETHLKGFRLPWEEEVLSSRSFDAAHGIYVASAEMEMLLLLVRDALKRRLRTRLAAWIKGGPAKGDLAREFAWLLDRADPDQVVSLATRLVGPAAEAPVRGILDRGLNADGRAAFAAVTRPAMQWHRTYRPLAAVILVQLRGIIWVLGGLSRHRFHWATPLRRVSPRGGICVALLGSDGAGKSTVSADTVTWFSQKLDVVPIYFGSGDGPASPLRMPLVVARKLVDRKAPSKSPKQRRSGVRGRMRSIARVPWALSLSLEKRGKLRRTIRARNRGMIVVCDRFPQDQVSGMNDGNLLGGFADFALAPGPAARAMEARPIAMRGSTRRTSSSNWWRRPNAPCPDVPEMTVEEIEDRISVVRSVRFPDSVTVVEVDADQPLEDVIRTVRRLVWKLL